MCDIILLGHTVWIECEHEFVGIVSNIYTTLILYVTALAELYLY